MISVLVQFKKNQHKNYLIPILFRIPQKYA